MTKPVQSAVVPEIGRDEQPDERDNEIVIELDRENQYGRTQPRANEPQGNHLPNTELIHITSYKWSFIKAKSSIHNFTEIDPFFVYLLLFFNNKFMSHIFAAILSSYYANLYWVYPCVANVY